MLGDLLKRKQLCATKRRIIFALAANPQRLHDTPERVERHAYIGRMGRTRALRGRLRASTGTR